MIRRKLMIRGWIFTGFALLIFLAFVFFSEKVFLQPVGTANMLFDKEVSTSQISLRTMQAMGTSTSIYALDGVKGFGWDINGDGKAEIFAGNGGRLIVFYGETNQHLLFIN